MATKFKITLKVSERELRLIGQSLSLGAASFDRVATKEPVTATEVRGEPSRYSVACECRDFLGALGVSLEQTADATNVVHAKYKGGFLK